MKHWIDWRRAEASAYLSNISFLPPSWSTESTLKRVMHKQSKAKSVWFADETSEKRTLRRMKDRRSLISLDVWVRPHRKDPSSEQLSQGTDTVMAVNDTCYVCTVLQLYKQWLFTTIVLTFAWPGIKLKEQVWMRCACLEDIGKVRVFMYFLTLQHWRIK